MSFSNVLYTGKREGQVIVVRDSDRSVCYQWSSADTRWVEIGDVVGTGQSKLPVHNGKEYDFVFSVDIVDGVAPLKLPYNRTDDPWCVAQQFIYEHDLPQDYLDTIAQFIIKNAGPRIDTPANSDLTYADPFTGADRYIPGMNGSKSPSAPSVERYFPVDTFITLKSLSLNALMAKLESFNSDANSPIDEATIRWMRTFSFEFSADDAQKLTDLLLRFLPQWPENRIFPFLDFLRCLVFWPKASQTIFDDVHWNQIYNLSLGHADLPQANCLLVLRLLANAVASDAPHLIESISTPPKSLITIVRLTPELAQLVGEAKMDISQRKQHQIALGTLIHNLAVFSYLATKVQLSTNDLPHLRVLPSLCIRVGFSLLSVAPTHGPGGVTLFHPDAISTLILAVGTALVTATLGEESAESTEMIKLRRIRLLASTVADTGSSSEDEFAAWEKVRQVITYWSHSSTCLLKIRDAAGGLLRLLE